MVAGTVGSTTVVLIAVESVRFSTWLDGERDDLPVAERQRQVAVGVAGNILEQAAFAVVGFDRISFGVVQPFAVDGPESLGVDRYFGRVSAYGTFSPALSSSGEVLPSAVTVQ